jgi:hypothetical protein
MRIYIAGPMRHYAEFNFPMFDRAAAICRLNNWEPINPAEHDRERWPDILTSPGYAIGDDTQCPGFDYAEAITWDIKQILDSDALLLLPNWEVSKGARLECLVAKHAGKLIFHSSYEDDGFHIHAYAPDSEVITVVERVDVYDRRAS